MTSIGTLSNAYDNIKEQWVSSLNYDKPSFILEATGTISSIIASGALGFFAVNPPMLLIFTFYLIGSICLTISSFRKKVQFWILIMMFWYNLVNITGLVSILMEIITV